MEEFSLIKKIILFPNASANHVGNKLCAFFDNQIIDYKTVGVTINWIIEICVLLVVKSHSIIIISEIFFLSILCTLPFIHIAIDYVFKKELTAIEQNYHLYYNMFFYSLYIIIVTCSILFVIYFEFKIPK